MTDHFDYGGRLRRLRTLMAEQEVDGLLLSIGADLPYFTGYEAMVSERLTCLAAAGEGPPVLLVPELEAPRIAPRPEVFEIRAWGETEDPVAMVAALLGGARRVALGDQTWARFVLALQERLPEVAFQPAAPLTRELRIRKDPVEIDLLRAAAAAADRVVARLAQHRFSGKSERELAREVAEMTVAEGHEVATFGIVASGPNGASPHHDPGDRVVQAGDAVVVDFGGRLHGYCSDTTRNFVVGEPPDGYAVAVEALRAAQQAAVEAVRPGVVAAAVDRVARDVIAAAGYGEYFIHRTGHGIGLEVHEDPYLVAGNDLALEAGMTFSVEPGIYLPGEWGMRLEDIVAVTPEGVERLNRSDRAPAVVG